MACIWSKMPFGQPMSFSPTSVTEVIFLRNDSRSELTIVTPLVLKKSVSLASLARVSSSLTLAPSRNAARRACWSPGVIAS